LVTLSSSSSTSFKLVVLPAVAVLKLLTLVVSELKAVLSAVWYALLTPLDAMEVLDMLVPLPLLNPRRCG
jgi:hypothetical protein